MPIRANRPCAFPGGCTQFATSGSSYCKEHSRRETHRQARAYHRAEWQHLYNDPRWKARRADLLAREPYCRECLRENRLTLATDVDHLIPHRGDERLFFGGPLQPLCHAHHAAKTAREVNGRGAVKKVLDFLG